MRSFGNAVHLASFIGSIPIMEVLLDSHADINSYGGYFETALAAALEGNHPRAVKTLVSRGIRVDQELAEHGTALQYACNKCEPTIIKPLLENGADVNKGGGVFGSPLAAAASRHSTVGTTRTTIIDSILNSKEKVQIRQCDLIAVVEDEDTDRLKRILDYDKENTMVPEDLIIGVLGNKFPSRDLYGILERLLGRTGTMGVTVGMLKVVWDPEMFDVLLQHNPICPITPDILISIAEKNEAQHLIERILEYDPKAPVNEDVLLALIWGYKRKLFYAPLSWPPKTLLQIILDRFPKLEITKAMVEACYNCADMV